MTSPKPRPTLSPGEVRAYPVLPLRDIVVFPHMIVPLFVGREKSITRARRSDAHRHVHPARHPEERLRRRSGDRRHLRGRHARERAAAAQAARRHREGAGRGRRAREGHRLYRPRRVLRGGGRGAPGRGRRTGRSGSARPLGRQRVRELRQAEQEGLARGRGRRSSRSRTTPSSPTRSLRISRSRFPTSRRSSRPSSSASAWRRC